MLFLECNIFIGDKNVSNVPNAKYIALLAPRRQIKPGGYRLYGVFVCVSGGGGQITSLLVPCII